MGGFYLGSGPQSGGGSVAAADITDASVSGKAVLTGTPAQGLSALGAQPKIGTPAAFTGRALAAADDGATLVCATAQTATVNTGLGAAGFNSVTFSGVVSFDGTATITDKRQAGLGYDFCTLVRTNVSGSDTYLAMGAKT